MTGLVLGLTVALLMVARSRVRRNRAAQILTAEEMPRFLRMAAEGSDEAFRVWLRTAVYRYHRVRGISHEAALMATDAVPWPMVHVEVERG